MYNQELEIRLKELSMVVDSYNPKTEWFMAAVIFSILAICYIVILEVGVFFGIILLALGSVPLLYMEMPANILPPNERVLSKRACALMSSCINLYKYPYDSTERMILCYQTDGNIELYQEFIQLFPHMASKKLKKLASVKIGLL